MMLALYSASREEVGWELSGVKADSFARVFEEGVLVDYVQFQKWRGWKEIPVVQGLSHEERAEKAQLRSKVRPHSL